MSCLNVTITPVAPSVLSVAPVAGASVTVETAAPATLSVTPAEPARVDVYPSPQASVTLTPTEGIRLTIGEVCSITGGDLYVLAASDGPLRTPDGGYILLKPPATTVGS